MRGVRGRVASIRARDHTNPAYLDGLAAEDYTVESAQVRAGYVGGLAARSALCALPLELLGGSDLNGEIEALMTTCLRLARVLVDMAREVCQET